MNERHTVTAAQWLGGSIVLASLILVLGMRMNLSDLLDPLEKVADALKDSTEGNHERHWKTAEGADPTAERPVETPTATPVSAELPTVPTGPGLPLPGTSSPTALPLPPVTPGDPPSVTSITMPSPLPTTPGVSTTPTFTPLPSAQLVPLPPPQTVPSLPAPK